MAVLPTGIGPVTGGYQIERSLRFNSADSAYLSRTPASAGNRKTWTWSGWFKGTTAAFSTLLSGFDGSAGAFYIRFAGNGGGINVGQYNTGGSTGFDCYTLAVTRDPSAWYHIVVGLDTTQATDTNRVKIYINSTLQTLTGTFPPQNQDCWINSTTAQAIGRFEAGIGQYANGCLTETYLIDGSAKTPSDFGETDSATGVWKPKAYSSTYGTNGFYLKFADNSGTTSTTLGKDSSGNSNNWTPNNFSVTAGAGNDSLVDSPTAYGTDTGVGGSVRGNYATWNPLDVGSSNMAASNGNLTFVKSSANFSPIRGSIAVTSGKYYFEMLANNSNLIQIGVSNGYNIRQGSGDNSIPNSGGIGAAWDSRGFLYYTGNSNAYAYTFTTNDVVMVAFDSSTGKIWFGKNGTWNTGDPAAGTSPAYTASGYDFLTPFANGESGGSGTTNFGQRAFAYTAPSGFKALCTTNLPTPTIGATSTTQANDYFNVVLYTGTSPSTNSVTGVNFQPDLVWVKSRTSGTRWHENYDVLRPNKKLSSNATDAEYTENMTFNSDGFTTSGGVGPNESGNSYVGWAWKANGAGSSNTAGTITSTVSANTTAGFSIVTYTGNATSGQSVGHGLGVKPGFIIVKKRSATGGWVCWHQALTGGSEQDRYIYLDLTSASGTTTNYWGSGGITSSTFGVWATGGDNNASGATFVAYCFAPVAGYSAFGSYTGNGASDGPFLYTGFRPRYVLIKGSSFVSNWYILDTARSPYNVQIDALRPNLDGAESSTGTYAIDSLSNGFKVRSSAADANTNGATFIWAAFAESPFKFSLAR